MKQEEQEQLEFLNFAFGDCAVDSLSVHLAVRRSGEAEFKFDQKLKLSRGQVSELRPEFRIRIRAYIQPRSESLRDQVQSCA